MRVTETNQTDAREPVRLDSETLAAIDKALEAYKPGEGMTIEEARELNRKRYRLWQAILKTPGA
jgi:hypothetical protein